MAKSASTGFIFRKSVYGVEHPATMKIRAANSATLKVGDLVRVNTSGFVVRAGAGNPAAGILRGIENQDGINVFSLGADAAGATLTPDDQVATKSSNQTDATYIQCEITIDVAGVDLYFNDANGDFAQTNLFQFFDVVAASGQIDQATASDANGQMQLMQLDPDGDGDASKGLFRLCENQYGLGIDTGTAKNNA